MLVVSNTSPISNLAIVGRLELLKRRYGIVRCGLAVAGVLGELIHAKHAGWIPNVREEIRRLRTEAGFFVDAAVEQFILSQVAE